MIQNQEKQTFLHSQTILQYFIAGNDQIDTLITCKPSHINLTTSDQSLYEALGSIKDEDNFNWRRLVKFLEVVDVISHRYSLSKRKLVLTQEYVDALRKKATTNQPIIDKNNKLNIEGDQE